MSEDSVQRRARGGERIELTLHRRIIHKRRSMERLDPGIDHKGAVAAPVPAAAFGTDAVDIDGRIGAGKGHPEEVVQVPGGKTAVVADHDQGETGKRVPPGVETAELIEQ